MVLNESFSDKIDFLKILGHMEASRISVGRLPS